MVNTPGYDLSSIPTLSPPTLPSQVSRNHASETHLFPNVVMRMPELRQIGARHHEHLNWFRSNWSRLKLPPLFAEIFDIPKCEEDLL